MLLDKLLNLFLQLLKYLLFLFLDVYKRQVTIQIHSPFVSNEFLMEEIKKKYGIQGGMVIPQADTDYLTDQVILNNVISYMNNNLKKYRKFGLGWGKNIGDLVQKLEVSEKKMELEGYVCPLVGNISMPTRDFHSNELVRIFSQMTFLKPYYLFAPALDVYKRQSP